MLAQVRSHFVKVIGARCIFTPSVWHDAPIFPVLLSVMLAV
jgi:hypothetical protein